MQVDPVILQLRADVADYQAKIEAASRLTDLRLSSIEKRGVQMSKSVNGAFSLAARSALAFGASFITLGLAKQFLDIADQAKNLDAQLRLATSGFGTFSQASEDVRRIAADTRSGLSETASLYGNFARATKELGGSQDQAARATETFAKTLKISGADANSAASATLQFGQALASGALRGDELNSILEASPRLARLLTESMGTSIGAIKQLGEEGKLTSDVLFRALTDTKFTDGIDAEFRTLPVTFDEAMTQVYNAAVITLGAFDRGGQFSTAIANFVTDGADGFADLESAAESFGRTLSSELAGIIAVAESVIGAIQRINDGLGGLPGAGLNKLGEYAGWLNPLTAGGRIVQMLPQYQQAAADRNRQLQGDANDQWARDTFGGMDVMGNRAGGAPRSTPRPAGGGGAGRRRTGPSAESLAAKAERDRLSSIRDEADTARDRARLEDDILNVRAAMATAVNDVYNFEMQIIEREKAARVTDLNTRVKMGELSQAEFEAQRGLVSELAQAQTLRALRNKQEAETAALERDQRDDLQTLAALSNTTTNRRERVDIEKRILDLQYQIERARLDEAIAAGQIADAAKARANLEARQAADTAALNRDSAGPLGQYIEGLRQSRENVGDEVQALVVDELNQVRDGIRGAIEDRLGVKDPLISGLLNLLIEQVILKPLAEALAGASGGGGSGIVGTLASIGTAIFGRASGGYVAPGQMVRVNEGASKGRVEGWLPSGGGKVIPLGQMNAMQSGGGGRVFQITIDARNSVNPEGFERKILTEAMRQAAQMDGQAAQTVIKNIPARMGQYERDGN